MQEKLLHYIWQHKLFSTFPLHTTKGEPVEIIHVGIPNDNAGADMFNAKIRISGTLWAGNIEIHLKSSDWNKHKHHLNKAYNSVILHVVKEADCDIFRQNGEEIPQIELKFSDSIVERYNQLLHKDSQIPCEEKLPQVSELIKSSWMETLLVERLMQKGNEIRELLNQNGNHWEEAFYIFLARNFGFGKNTDAFMRLAKSLPLSYLGRHKDNLFQLEAILLGQSGLLAMVKKSDEYTLSLQKEYHFLQQKFQLQPLDGSIWKLFRLRPMNFPYIRIAQFAALIHNSSKLFSKIIENPEPKILKKLFDIKVSDYWLTHYISGEQSPRRTKKLTQSTIDTLIINTVVPFLFVYGQTHNEEEFSQKAIQLLEKLPAEKNSIVNHFSSLGLNASSANQTQALIQLRTVYCDEKKCLHCRIGHELMKV